MSTTLNSDLIARLSKLLGPESLITSPSELVVYECDGYVIDKNSPDVVVFPESADDVAGIVQICNELKVPFVPRGAGTSLAGGCLHFLRFLQPIWQGSIAQQSRGKGAGIHDANLSFLQERDQF